MTAPEPESEIEIDVADLRSTEEAVSEPAWDAAYPRLWREGMKVAGALLRGEEHEEDRKDAAARAIDEVMTGLLRGKPESFNQIASFRDVVCMTCAIVRRRIHDFHRSRAVRREDAMAEVPEQIWRPAGLGARDFAELWELVEGLAPPKPELFHDRFVLGYSADEIAERRAMPRNTVLSHFFKGFKQLRSALNPEPPSPI